MSNQDQDRDNGGMAGGVRRPQQAQAGEVVRSWNAGSGIDQMDPQSSGTAQLIGEGTTLNLGRNAQMARKLVEQAVLRSLNKTLKSRGLNPADMIDFLNRARVTFLDPSGQEVKIGAALITWEE